MSAGKGFGAIASNWLTQSEVDAILGRPFPKPFSNVPVIPIEQRPIRHWTLCRTSDSSVILSDGQEQGYSKQAETWTGWNFCFLENNLLLFIDVNG